MSDSTPPVQPPAAQPQPVTPGSPVVRGNGFGIASMILGIVTVAGFAIPVLNVGAIVLGIVGLILGIVGLVVKNRPRKAAIAGVILSAVGLILSIVLVAIYSAALAGASKALSDTASASATPAASASASASASSASAARTLTYSVTSDGGTAQTVSYSTIANGSSGTEQANGAALPFTKDIALPQSGAFDFPIASLTAQASSSATTITCAISVNGKQVSTQTSTGAYAVVSCTASGSALGG